MKRDRNRSFLSTQGQSSSSQAEYHNHVKVGSFSVYWAMLTIGWKDSHCWSSQSDSYSSFCFDFSQYGRKISKERRKPNGTCGFFFFYDLGSRVICDHSYTLLAERVISSLRFKRCGKKKFHFLMGECQVSGRESGPEISLLLLFGIA